MGVTEKCHIFSDNGSLKAKERERKKPENPSLKEVWNFFSPNHLVCFMSSEVFIVVDLFCISSIEMSNKSSKKELLKKIHAKEIVRTFVLTGYHCYLYILLLSLFDLPFMPTVGLKIIPILY